MKRFVQSPYFFFGFVLLTGISHYLILEYNGAGNAVEHFIQNDWQGKKETFSAGPLIFSFYELLSHIFHSERIAINAGTALLAGTLTYVLLKFSSKLNSHPLALIFLGAWTTFSPTLRHSLNHYPHLILGMVFFLLLFLSLKGRNYFLLVVFLIHLFLTQFLLAILSIILVSAILLNREKSISDL